MREKGRIKRALLELQAKGVEFTIIIKLIHWNTNNRRLFEQSTSDQRGGGEILNRFTHTQLTSGAGEERSVSLFNNAISYGKNSDISKVSFGQ